MTGKESAPKKARERSALPRGTLVAIIASTVAFALIAGGIALALVIGNRAPDMRMPATAAELRASSADALDYLNADGKKLASERTDGLTIYSAGVSLDDERNAVSGEQSVLYTNGTGEELSEVVLRVYANSPAVRGGGKEVSVTAAKADGRPAETSLDGSLLAVALPSRLAAGSSVLISFSFSVPVPEFEAGPASILGTASRGGYGIFGHSGDTYNLGYLLPTVTVYSDGAWEKREVPAFGDASYSECALFDVSIDVPKEYVVAATGALKEERTGGGRRVYRYAAGPARDFAVQASPSYRVTERKVGRTVVASYYRPGSEKPGGKALDYAAGALEEYREHIGPYPYTRLNVCEAPLAGGAAGMEFTGLIQIAQILYGDLGIPDLDVPGGLEEPGENIEELLSPLADSLLGETLEFVIAHEVCHQWFALVVGSDSLAHPWQDESLVNFCSVLYFRWRYDEGAASRVINSQLVMAYQSLRLGGDGDMPADSPVDAFDSPEQYTAVVYGKGALFFRELEDLMGREAFEKSLRDYYREYAFRLATPGDMLAAFTSNAKDPDALASLHRRWILEAHGDEDVAGAIGIGPLEGLMEQLRDMGDVTMGPLKEFLEKLRREGGLDMDILDDFLEDLFQAPEETPGDTVPSFPDEQVI